MVTSLARVSDGALLVVYDDGDGGIDRVVPTGDSIAATSFFMGDPAMHPLVLTGVDASGSVWVSTRMGMEIVGRDGIARTHLGDGDGLPSEVSGREAFVVDVDGSVHFGSARGLGRDHPRPTPPPRPAPVVTILPAWAGDPA
ncbi:MAG: hypothetical protein ACHREM_10340, partial [Polyangiales bacterium]